VLEIKHWKKMFYFTEFPSFHNKKGTQSDENTGIE
jgi:hypothetical protein